MSTIIVSVPVRVLYVSAETLPRYPLTLEILAQIINGDFVGDDDVWIYWPDWVDCESGDRVLLVQDSDSVPDIEMPRGMLPWIDLTGCAQEFEGVPLIDLWLVKSNWTSRLQRWARAERARLQGTTPIQSHADEAPVVGLDADVNVEGADYDALRQAKQRAVDTFIVEHGMLKLLLCMYTRQDRTGSTKDKLESIVCKSTLEIDAGSGDKCYTDYQNLLVRLDPGAKPWLIAHCNALREQVVADAGRSGFASQFKNYAVEVDRVAATGNIAGQTRVWSLHGAYVSDSLVATPTGRRFGPGFSRVGSRPVAPVVQAAAWAVLLRQFGDSTTTYVRKIDRFFWSDAGLKIDEINFSLVNDVGLPYTASTIGISPFLLYDASISEAARVNEIAAILLDPRCNVVPRVCVGDIQQYPMGFYWSLCAPVCVEAGNGVKFEAGSEIASLENARSIRKSSLLDKSYFKSGYAMIDYGIIQSVDPVTGEKLVDDSGNPILVQQLEDYNPEVVRMLHIADDIIQCNDPKYCASQNLPYIEYFKDGCKPVKVVICTRLEPSTWISLTPKLDKMFGTIGIEWFVQPLDDVPLQFAGEYRKRLVTAENLKKDLTQRIIYVRLENPAGENDYYVKPNARRNHGVLNQSFSDYAAAIHRVYLLVSWSAKRTIIACEGSVTMIRGDVPAPELIVSEREGKSCKITTRDWREVYGAQNLSGVGTVPVGHNPHTAQRILKFDLQNPTNTRIQVTIGYTVGSIASAAKWGVYETVSCSLNRFMPQLLYQSDRIKRYNLEMCRVITETQAALTGATVTVEY